MTLHLFRHFNSQIPKNNIWIIGNFDGLHKGHCTLINKAFEIAKHTYHKVGILSFYPHPREFFNPNDSPINIMQFSEKFHTLQKMNIDYYYLHPFDAVTATMSAIDFCQKIKQQLAPSHIIVGYDFHFGKNRTGTPQILSDFCLDNHINCTIMPPALADNGTRYASQAIRQFLSDGNISAVKSFLPYDYILTGRVEHGKKQARQLGFPTANIALKNIFLPKFGVYKCRIINMDNRIAIANIGIKPTLYQNYTPLLEVHIPHFSGDLYGKKLRIAFDAFIRPEIKFASLDALKIQIKQDIQGL